MCYPKQKKLWLRCLAALTAFLSILVLVSVCSVEGVYAYSAAQRRSIKPDDVLISRERFLKSAAAHVKRANQVGYGYNRMLNGTTYYPLAGSTQKFCCVDLVTHVIYAATASRINGNYKAIDQTLATQHTFDTSNGIVFDTQTVSVLGSQIGQMPAIYQSLGGKVNPTSLKLGDIVLTGDKNGSALSHAVLVIGKVTSAENAFMQIPNHNPNTIYFISMSSTSLASYRGVSWLNRAWYNDDPNKGYFIKEVYRLLPALRQIDAGGFRFRKTDANSGEGLSGAEFRLTRPDGSTQQIVMTSDAYTSTKTYSPGVYTLIETKAPPGYSIDPTPKTFTVESDTINGIYWDSPIKNTSNSGLVKIIKKDAVTGLAVARTVFDLSQDPTFPAKTSIRLNTGADGSTVPNSFLINNGATVYVREVSVPDPYLVDTNVKSVKLTQGGLATVEFHNNRAQGRIEVIKKDSISKEPIGEVTFEVKDAEGKIVDVITTGIDGKATTKLLPIGTYTLRETIPAEGYQSNSTVYTAELTYADMNTSVVRTTIEVENDPIHGKIRIIKRSKDDAVPVEGAVFELLGANETPAVDLLGNPIPYLISDRDGFALTPDLRYGTYIVREIGAPDGYYLNEEEYEVAVATSEMTIDLIIHNEKIQLRLRLKKMDSETDLPLSGAEFKVVEEKEISLRIIDPEDGQAPWSEVLVTDENGEAVSDELLEAGRYRLVEVKAPEGYIPAADVHFEITCDTNYVDVDLIGRIFDQQIGNMPTIVAISKKSITGDDELPGATLKLFEKGSSVIVDEWISDEEPHFIKQLKIGTTYVLQETIAPLGYAVTETIEFTVASTCEVQAVVMRDFLTQVNILKKDAATGEPLEGIRFGIENLEGERLEFVFDEETEAYMCGSLAKVEGVADMMTNENGSILIYGIPTGGYQLIELEAKSGYECLKPYPFVVSTTTSVRSPIEIVLENRKTNVTIAKTDHVTGAPVSGAVVEICDEQGEVLCALATDCNGNAIAEGLPAGRYIFKEILAPDGYVLDEGEFKFTVDIYGSVEGVTEFTNQPARLVITKVSTADLTQTLEGAEFQIFGLKEDDELELIRYRVEDDMYIADTTGETDTVASDCNGTIDIIGLPFGQYSLKEIKSPAGYSRLNQAIDFILSDKVATVELTVSNKLITVPPTGEVLPGIGLILVGAASLFGVFGIIIVTKKKIKGVESR